METPRSKNYHDYVIVGAKFIGEFEQMYQNCDDPWHQIADGLSEREPLRRLALQEIRRMSPKSVLDVGCGLGYFTDQMSLCVQGSDLVGVDISETAVSKASATYPNCRFQVLGALELDVLQRKFDLVVCNEILWYILNDLRTFFEKVSAISHEETVLMIMQFFPPPMEQEYGRDVFVGVEGLIKLIPFRVIKSIEVNRLLNKEERERQGKAGSHKVLILCDGLLRR